MEGSHPWPGERAYWRSVWQGWLGSEQKKVNLQNGAEPHEGGDELTHDDLQEDDIQKEAEEDHGKVQPHMKSELQEESLQEESELHFEDCQNMESGIWSLEYDVQMESQQDDLRIELQEVDLHGEVDLDQEDHQRGDEAV